MSIDTLQNITDSPRPNWAAVIMDELDEAEQTLSQAIRSDVAAASELSTRLLHAGGKRIRPALLLLSALAVRGRPAGTPAINLAAAVELVHMASLVHDDVVDETRERRGAATANACWGNKLSVLGGDYLLARAFSILAKNARVETISLLSSTAVRMAESEVLQASVEGDLAAWESHYYRIISGKTAGFMSACCETGARTVGGSPEECRSLALYGEELGIAFQIMDDILDIEGDPMQVGKDIGVDITRGKFTLPVILAMRLLNSDKRTKITNLLSASTISAPEAREIAHMAAESGAIDEARDTARKHARRAAEIVHRLPVSDFTEALTSLTNYVILRRA